MIKRKPDQGDDDDAEEEKHCINPTMVRQEGKDNDDGVEEENHPPIKDEDWMHEAANYLLEWYRHKINDETYSTVDLLDKERSLANKKRIVQNIEEESPVKKKPRSITQEESWNGDWHIKVRTPVVVNNHRQQQTTTASLAGVSDSECNNDNNSMYDDEEEAHNNQTPTAAASQTRKQLATNETQNAVQHSKEQYRPGYYEDSLGRLVPLNRVPWEEHFQQLVEYKTKHGTVEVPRSDPLLGNWVTEQRKSRKSGKLSQCRVQWLNSLGFQWDVHLSAWMKMYNELLSYKELHGGSINVPVRYNGSRKLGGWVRKQRERRSSLSKQRIALLESIGFEWESREILNQESWMGMYERLKKYKQEHNSTSVPLHYKADPKLGRWVSKQRHRCKEKERVDLLNQIGFVWEGKNRRGTDPQAWMEMYERLKKYKQEHNSTSVPTRYKVDPKLGKWVSKQRQSCNKKERVDLLNKIGFAWKG